MLISCNNLFEFVPNTILALICVLLNQKYAKNRLKWHSFIVDSGAITSSQCQWHDLWPVGQIVNENMMDKNWRNFATDSPILKNKVSFYSEKYAEYIEQPFESKQLSILSSWKTLITQKKACCGITKHFIFHQKWDRWGTQIVKQPLNKIWQNDPQGIFYQAKLYVVLIKSFKKINITKHCCITIYRNAL